jgi:hypothetical protein
MKNNKKEVLTPDHKWWPIFRRQLDDTLFTYTNNKIHNRCNGDLTLTIEILESMKTIDIKETLIVMRENGGNCDCKIASNVTRIWRNK